MKSLPTIVTSSVVRSSHQGESHGGVYLVNLQAGTFQQVIDWNEGSINWEGRGADRGLRGIAFYNDEVYLAASDEIFIYDKQFRLQRSLRNRYLKHCHEITIYGDTLCITSTGFDSVLTYDLRSGSFDRGYCLRFRDIGKLRKKLGSNPLPSMQIFNPNSNKGPALGDTTHINNIFCNESELLVSGTKLGHMLKIRDSKLTSYARIPLGTHNARPFKGGVLLNNTAMDGVCYLDHTGKVLKTFEIKYYGEEELVNSSLPRDNARQGFGRGLCVNEDLIIGGSSPATVSVYRFDTDTKPYKTVNLTLDVRNAIHGLEVWPL